MKKPGSLRTLRQRAGLTLEEVADAAGCTPQHVAEIEHGRRKPATTTLRAILDAIDAMPPIDPDVELVDDMKQEPGVLMAEAEMIHAGIEEAAERIGRGEDRDLNLRFVAHAMRRQRAILAAVRTLVQQRTAS